MSGVDTLNSDVLLLKFWILLLQNGKFQPGFWSTVEKGKYTSWSIG